MLPDAAEEQATTCIREINQALAQAEIKLLLARKRLMELGAVLADVQQLQQRSFERPDDELVPLKSGATVDLRRKLVRRGDTVAPFTKRGWDLVTILLQGPKTNSELLLGLWGGSADENTARKCVRDTRQTMARVGADVDLARVGPGCYELLRA